MDGGAAVGECYCRCSVWRRESGRQVTGDVSTHGGPGADLLQPYEHGPAAGGREPLHVEVFRPAVDAALSFWLRPQLHDFQDLELAVERVADAGFREVDSECWGREH